MDSNELKHYGVLGMKWGVRRGKSSTGSGERTSRSKKSDDYIRTKSLRKKKISQLSNSELKDLNNRMQLEQQYKQLKKQQTSAGRKFVKDIAYETSKNIASEYAKKNAKRFIKYLFTNEYIKK